MQKIYRDPRIERVIERQIIRAHTHTHLWHPDLLPINRLFLFYGQPGLGISEAVQDMLKGANYRHIQVNRDSDQLKRELVDQANDESETPILLLSQGHLLKYHRDLFRHILNLKETMPYLFIIVISEEVPDEDHPFYDQFDVKVVSGLPPISFHRKLLEYYFYAWKSHWPHSEMQLTEADLDWLSQSCDSCTPKDVELFVQRIFAQLLDRYPEESIDISRALLEDKNNGFMFDLNGFPGILCITSRDGRKAQQYFDPKGISDAPPPQVGQQPKKKRAKTEVEIQ